MKRYRKQAKIAMAVALATTSLGNSVPTLSAKEETNIQENDFEKKDDTSKIEVPVEMQDPIVKDEEVIDENISEIEDVLDEVPSLENTPIENKEENSSVEKTDTVIKLTEEFFPDPGLREELRKVVYVGEDDVIAESTLENTFWLFLGGTEENPKTNIRSLEGIQYFYNLSWIDCNFQTELAGTLDFRQNKKLTRIQARDTKIDGLKIDGLDYLNVINVGNTNISGTFDLRNCENLEIINFSNTNISDINIDGLTKLTHFFIFNTDVGREFDFRNCPSLEVLSVYNTNVSAVNIDGLTNLTIFSISGTSISGEFDLSRNTNLKEIYASNTGVSELNIDGLTNLTIFDISESKSITGELDLSKNAGLQVIQTYNTQITGLNIDGLTNLTKFSVGDNKNLQGSFDLSANTSLEYLNVCNTQVSQLNITGLTNLVNFYIHNTNIEGAFDLSRNANLKKIYASNTGVSELNIDGLTNLVEFIADNTKLNGKSLDFSGNAGIKIIRAQNSGIHGVNIDGLTNLTTFDVSLNENIEGEFDFRNCAPLQFLSVFNTKVSQIDVTGLTNLVNFYIHNTLITGSFDLSENRNLKYVHTNNTGVSGINVDGLTSLVEFEATDCEQLVGEYDFTGNPLLEFVGVSNTKVSNINVQGLSKLAYLGVAKTQIEGVLDLRGCTSLQTLNAYEVQIGGVLDLRSCTLLQTLNAYNTQLTGVNIDGLTRLVKFDVDDNPNLVGEIDLSSNTGLQVARARNTKITGFNINGLKNLTSVDVSLNPQLVGEFDFTSNTALNYLNLNRIGITSVNIQGLRNLTVFAIQDTPIPNLDVSTNTSLEQLNAATNLTWLNVGDNPNLSFFATRNSVIDLGEIGDSFNIATVTEAFKGIDISKVTMVSGATYDPTTGEVSGYQNGTPIVYNYDSGTMENGEAVSITVTLNFTKPLTASEININSYEGKRYDGTAVSNPTDITKTGSSGVVTFEWFRKTADGNWESLGNLAPVNAGEYGVKAHLAADLHYAAADSGEPTPFTITQASSSIHINSYEDKEWDGNPVSDPSNITRTENTAEVIFKYYRADDMTTEIAAPSEVGEYVVKAVLSGDANYTDSESNLVHFRIVGLRTEITLTYRDHIYTGNPVADPQKDVHYTVQGSTGAVSVEWYNANDLTTPLEQAPVNVGSYVVKVSVAGTTSHVGASATASFQITQASSTISINNYVGKNMIKTQ